MIKEINGRWTCDSCGQEWSAMVGDNEIPDICDCTIESNKLIAEFVTDEPEVLKMDLKKAGTVESMHYHSSWDWLMPVVEKIEDTEDEYKYNVVIGYQSCGIENNTNCDQVAWADEGNKIDSVYAACVEFIKRWNKSKS